ncbi:ABC transporter permease [Niallia sp. Krafla_26]|uniref:ABC transporter permease n=1 Tax=Niallia sp. Krafla_26 TaxID=3064703 RepID=UPI003D16D826
MVIVKNNFKRLFKNKLNWVWFIILPVILLGMLIQGTVSSNTFRVAVVDLDQTEYTELLKGNIREMAEVHPYNEEEMKDAVLNSEVDYGILIEKGLTDSLVDGEEASIKGYSIKESNISIPVKLNIESFLSSSIHLGKVTSNENDFYNALDTYNEGFVDVENVNINEESNNIGTLSLSVGVLALCILLMMTFSTTLIIKDKDSNMYQRCLTSPISSFNYHFQHLISYFLVSIIQIVLLLMVMGYIIDIDLSPYLLELLILFFAFSLSGVALGIAVTSFCRTSKQANAIIGVLVIPMSMLGGSLWDRSIMPESLQQVSLFVPTTWLVEGARKLFEGSNLMELLPNVGILLAFTVVFFMIGQIVVAFSPKTVK